MVHMEESKESAPFRSLASNEIAKPGSEETDLASASYRSLALHLARVQLQDGENEKIHSGQLLSERLALISKQK